MLNDSLPTVPPRPRELGRRPEPRWLTLADLGVVVAGFALVMAIPPRSTVWPFYLGAPPILLLLGLGCLRFTLEFGLVLTLVVLWRRGRYGGQLRPAEWLALTFAASSLLEAVPNLDDAVNAYYVAVGSTTLDFGVARWLLAAPAVVGLALVGAGLLWLRRRVLHGLRIAAAMLVVGVWAALCLWLWGPCEAARLELPWLLMPSPRDDPSTWGWRGLVVFALRDVVATGPTALTWGIPAAASVQAWRANRRLGQQPFRAWTELAAGANAVLAACLLLTLTFLVVGPDWRIDFARRVLWVVGIGFSSWWLAGRIGSSTTPLPFGVYMPQPIAGQQFADRIESEY